MHLDILRLALNAGQQAADATHQQADAHAGTAGLGQAGEHVAVGQRIELHENLALATGLDLHDLAVDQVQDALLEAGRRDQQVVVLALQVADQHIFKEARRIRADIRVGRHQAEVGVLLGGLFVVVAGADLRDILDVPAVLPGDQADLGVHLEALDAVGDGAAGLLQALRPVDVVFLVKPGAQLKQRGDVLAVFGGLGQVADDFGRARQAVNRDLDADDRGVGRGLAQQAQEGIHAFIGEVQQDVPPQDLREHRPVAAHHGRRLGRKVRVGDLEALGQLVGQAEHIAHLERRVAVVYLRTADAQAAAQLLDQVVRQAALYLQAHRRQAPALFKHLFHVRQVIAVDVEGLVLRADVGVARDLDDRRGLDLALPKHLAGVGHQDFLRQHIAHARAVQEHHRRQRLRHRDDAERRAPAALDAQHDVQHVVGQVRERVVHVDHLGRQHGQHVIYKIFIQELFVRPGERVRLAARHAEPAQRVLDLAEGLVALLIERRDRLEDFGELALGRPAALVVDVLLLHEGDIGQAADADHKEFVQVALEDGHEFQALVQRDAGVLRLLQHTLVKTQPGKLAVLCIADIVLAQVFHIPRPLSITRRARL